MLQSLLLLFIQFMSSSLVTCYVDIAVRQELIIAADVNRRVTEFKW